MEKESPVISLIVSTLGRTGELKRLLVSCSRQTYRDFEVIVVDQNSAPRLDDIMNAQAWNFPLRRIRTDGERGVSRGRNRGLREARGTILVFPDDDCWYPDDFLERGVALMGRSGCDILTGRSADESGRPVNGRYSARPGSVNARNIWISHIEWACFIHRGVFERIGGYDESLGPGSGTPWGAAEGVDLVLRALSQGFRAQYDPALYGHHDALPVDGSPAAVDKGRAYARGMGYVLRRHGAGVPVIAYWAARSLFNSTAALVRGKLGRSRYFAAVARGRLEGWRGVT